MARILIVDDIQENRYLLEVLLRGYGFDTASASNGEEALAVAERQPFDLVIADILMPVMDGYALCRAWKADPRLRGIPFIFYTATYTEPEDEQFSLRLGADRFLVKPQEPEELHRVISEVLAEARNVSGRPGSSSPVSDQNFLECHNKALSRKLENKMTQLEQTRRALVLEKNERAKLEASLTRCEEKIRGLLNASPLAILWLDSDGAILFANMAFSGLFGYRAQELSSVFSFLETACDGPEQRAALLRDVLSKGPEGEVHEPVIASIRHRDGDPRQVSVICASISDVSLMIFSDLTAYKQLEEQLLHAQKMELVGQMAGAAFHDLRNVLTAIVGYGYLLMSRLPQEDPSRQYANHIVKASDLAANLTKSICEFSRKQKPADVEPIDLNETIREADGLLRQLIPCEISLCYELLGEVVTVRADPDRIKQVLMNLVTNARDAIGASGVITIGTSMSTFGDKPLPAGTADPSLTYARLRVEDTGDGMDAATKQRLFDPFFTTKEAGKGTGLGLSVVHEIVSMMQGFIEVWSEPGEGSAFTIHLPLSGPE